MIYGRQMGKTRMNVRLATHYATIKEAQEIEEKEGCPWVDKAFKELEEMDYGCRKVEGSDNSSVQ